MEQCRVITPCGVFTAVWPDDEELPVRYEGDFDAIAFFRSFLENNAISGNGGSRLEFALLEPGDLRGFCDKPEMGVAVEQDLDAEVVGDE